MLIAIVVLLIGVIVICVKLNSKKYKCSSCRYLANRNRHGIQADTCKILGCPACVDECRFYERMGTYSASK